MYQEKQQAPIQRIKIFHLRFAAGTVKISRHNTINNEKLQYEIEQNNFTGQCAVP